MYSSNHLINATKNAFYLKILCINNIKYLTNSVETRYYHTPYKSLVRLSTLNDCQQISSFKLSKSLCLRRHESTDIKPIPKPNENLDKKKKKKPFVGIASIEQNLTDEALNFDTEWKRVYVCPFILAARIFARFKLYQTILMCGSVPICGALYLTGNTSLERLQTLFALSVFACLLLNLFGQIFRRLVGAVYISECRTLTRISCLTFFGNRREVYTSISDIQPLSDVNDNLSDFYCTLERFSSQEKLYLSLKFGGILDREGFEQIFGKDSAIFPDNQR